MIYFTRNQLADAMGLEPEALSAILLSCGISTTQEQLSREDVAVVQEYLQQQDQALSRRAQERLEQSLEDHTVLLDTCTLLHYQFSTWMERALPVLRRTGQALIVPSSVVQELQHLQTKKPELSDAIRTASRWLQKLQQEGLLKVYGSEADGFGDQQLLSVATRFLTRNRLLVVTQDGGLAADLLRLNQLHSVQGKRLLVFRINRYGYLSRFHTDGKRSASSSSYIPAAPLVTDGQEMLPVANLPLSGDTVLGTNGPLVLGAVLGRGGEGIIYDLGDGTAAKIYHAEKLTAARRDKLQLMVTHPIRCSGVCWPQELLCTQQGEFVGYRMARASGTPLQRCLLNQASVLKHFPSGRRVELVQLAVTVLEKIQALHQSGVLLGDINLNNLLMVSPREVWLVDCDSYQVGGYPCPVGKSQFVPPELQGKRFSELLRTPGNEAFAVATLLFMLMLPGKAPYAQQGGDSMEDAIRRMEFPYPCGDNHGSGVPEGSWRYQWSHLPLYVKGYFYDTFQKDGRFSTEDKRLPVAVWLSVFHRYLELLENGDLERKDEQSGRIYPNRMKQRGQDARQVTQRRICRDCGDAFDLTAQEEAYYREKGFYLPQSCARCRQLKRLCKTNVDGQMAG